MPQLTRNDLKILFCIEHGDRKEIGDEPPPPPRQLTLGQRRPNQCTARQ